MFAADREGNVLPRHPWEEGSAVLASVVAAGVVVAVIVLAFVTDVLAAREQAQVRRLRSVRSSRGAHERDRRRPPQHP